MSEPVCQECGSKLQVTESHLIPGHARGTPGAPDYLSHVWVCTNPDCPTNDTDMAKAAGPKSSQ